VPDYLSREDASALCDKILSYSGGDAAQVRLVSGLNDFTRYVGNEVRTSGDATNTEAIFTAFQGDRRGSVRWNDMRDAAIVMAVARAAELAAVAPDDPESMPVLRSQQCPPSEAFFDSTSQVTDEEETDTIVAVTDRAAARNVIASGLLQRLARSEAVANSAGLFAYHRSTLASHTVTVRVPEGAGDGWNATSHNDWLRLTSPEDLADRASEEARQSAAAASIEPGPHTVVLGPTAVGRLLVEFVPQLDARTVHEGRSFFSRDGGGAKVGEQVVDERLSLFSDPGDPDLLGRPFTSDGMAVTRTEWVQSGVLSSLAYSRYWAAQQNHDVRPVGGGLKLAGGSGAIDEIVSTVETGLLVTRIAHLRTVDPRRLLIAGLITDGAFSIAGGRIVGGVSGFRFTASLASILNSVDIVGSTERVVASELGHVGFPIAAPTLVIRELELMSASDPTQ